MVIREVDRALTAEQWLSKHGEDGINRLRDDAMRSRVLPGRAEMDYSPKITAKERAARALDLTHAGEHSQLTLSVRQTLAAWLDGSRELPRTTVLQYCGYLETVKEQQ